MTGQARTIHRPDFLVEALLAFSALLLVFTIVSTLLYLRAPLRSPADSARSLAAVSVAGDFFTAINGVIRTGETDRLMALTSPDLVEHPARVGIGTGRKALLESLLRTRSISPSLNLLVDSAVPSADGDEVTVRIRAAGAPGGSFLGLPIPANLETWGWGPIEILRVADGLVVERWSGHTPDASLEQLMRVELPLANPDLPRLVALIRLSFERYADLQLTNGLATRVLMVETGTITVKFDNPELRVATTAKHTVPVIVPTIAQEKPPVILRAGELLLTPPGETTTLTNESALPARLLMVVRFGVGWGISAGGEITNAIGVEIANLTLDRPAGVTPRLLAQGLMPVEISGQTLALGRVTMVTGESLSWPSINGPVLIAVDEGNLEVTGGAERRASSQSGSHIQAIVDQVPDEDAGLVVGTGSGSIWRATGPGPVAVLVLTLT